MLEFNLAWSNPSCVDNFRCFQKLMETKDEMLVEMRKTDETVSELKNLLSNE